MLKKSKKPGKNTSSAEIQNISKQGIWIFAKDQEFFLPFTRYPWFKKATIAQIYDFKFYRGHHFHWPKLDIDITLESLENPERFPLRFR